MGRAGGGTDLSDSYVCPEVLVICPLDLSLRQELHVWSGLKGTMLIGKRSPGAPLAKAACDCLRATEGTVMSTMPLAVVAGLKCLVFLCSFSFSFDLRSFLIILTLTLLIKSVFSLHTGS